MSEESMTAEEAVSYLRSIGVERPIQVVEHAGGGYSLLVEMSQNPAEYVLVRHSRDRECVEVIHHSDRPKFTFLCFYEGQVAQAFADAERLLRGESIA
jgi:hypothetical protein